MGSSALDVQILMGRFLVRLVYLKMNVHSTAGAFYGRLGSVSWDSFSETGFVVVYKTHGESLVFPE